MEVTTAWPHLVFMRITWDNCCGSTEPTADAHSGCLVCSQSPIPWLIPMKEGLSVTKGAQPGGMHSARGPSSQSWVWEQSHRPGRGCLSCFPCCDLTSPRPGRWKGQQSSHRDQTLSHYPGELSAVWKCSLSTLSSMAATSFMWLLKCG